ncbi:MAG: FGGY family carbohydrate kinase, partial [Planctomycetota bacterium]
MSRFLGIDVGTSGTKAIVLDDAGKVLGTGSGRHEPDAPRPGWSEQDPEAWWPSSLAAIRDACRDAGI